MIEFKSPSAEQTKEMQEFGALMNQVLEMIIKHKESRQASLAFTKAEECIQWFNSAIMNMTPEVIDPLAPAPVEPVEGEVVLDNESCA